MYALIGFHHQERADALLDEALRMENLDHPNVLTLIGVCIDEPSTPCVVMPYMANGSLLAHLRRTNSYVLLNSCEQRLVRSLSPHSSLRTGKTNSVQSNGLVLSALNSQSLAYAQV